MTRITFRNVLLGGPVWAVRRGHWQPAEMIARGRACCRIKFIDTRNCAKRRYEELSGRCTAKNSQDRPLDPAETATAA